MGKIIRLESAITRTPRVMQLEGLFDMDAEARSITNIEMNTLSKEQWTSLFTNANKAGARTCECLGAREAFKHLSNEIFN